MNPIRCLALVGLVLALGGPGSAGAAAGPAILFTRFGGSPGAFASGTFSGTQLDQDHVVLEPAATDGTWTAPAVSPGFAFGRLVASWNASTPAAGTLTIQAQVSTADGPPSDWYTLGVWAASDQAQPRTSIAGQRDQLGRVDTDTLYARDEPFVRYTLRIQLHRASVDDPSPAVRLLGAEVSDGTLAPQASPSAPSGLGAVELPVPAYSQEIHAHQYPQWGGGGEAWCSPTSTEMVIEYWGTGPMAEDLGWVNPSYVDPSVDAAARSTYDAAYHGTGNWPFNAAYAASFGLEAFVSQLRSLAEAEQFIRAGIPLVASIAARPGELQGFLFSGGTNGHLVVIVGFDAAGNPIVNDPAAWSDGGVRRVYDRGQFERVWLRGSSGTVYVIHPLDVPLPPPPAELTPNW